MTPKHGWPIAVVAVLALTVVANVAVLYVASDDDAAAIEPDYYQKALAWDSTLVARRASDKLGWSATVALERARSGEAELTARLRDASGNAVEGALVRVEAIHNRIAAHPVRAELPAAAALGPGVYAASVPLARAGMWEIRLVASRGGDVFVADLRSELADGAR